MGRKGCEGGRRVSWREEVEGERAGKGKGGLDLDICRRAPEFLVTPLVTQTDTDRHRAVARTRANISVARG